MEPYEQVNSGPIRFSIWRTFKHHIPRFMLTILVDVILPLATFLFLQQYIKAVYALLAASSPPLIMVIIKGIWLWTFDALGFLVFITFAITALVALISRNPFILLLEKSLMTGLLSIIFGITLIPCQCFHRRCRWRPMAYYFYQDLVPTTRADLGLSEDSLTESQEQRVGHYAQLEEDITKTRFPPKQEIAQVYQWLYKQCSSFKISCYCITCIWSIGFLSEFLARLTLILLCDSIRDVVIYGHIILSSITALLILLTIGCIAIERKYTIAFVERWKTKSQEQSQPRHCSLTDPSTITAYSHSNCILSIDI